MEILITEDVLSYMATVTDEVERHRIGRYLDRQEQLGFRIKEPVSKPLGHGIYEVRPGPHRLLFFYARGQIVVIHAFRKKTPRTPGKEIDTAIRRREEWMG